MFVAHLPVQEIFESGKIVPKEYIQPKDGDKLPPLLMNYETIDCSLLSISNHEELAKLRCALITWGCAQVCPIYSLFKLFIFINLFICYLIILCITYENIS